MSRPLNKDRVVIKNRNLSITQMLAEDKERQEIADKFELSKRTVENAIDMMRLEYDCKTVPCLVYKLFKLGLIK